MEVLYCIKCGWMGEYGKMGERMSLAHQSIARRIKLLALKISLSSSMHICYPWLWMESKNVYQQKAIKVMKAVGKQRTVFVERLKSLGRPIAFY